MADSKETPIKFLVFRSALDGKVERVFVTTEEKTGRTKFLRSASLKAVPKKSYLKKGQAQSAVKRYFREHAIEMPAIQA